MLHSRTAGLSAALGMGPRRRDLLGAWRSLGLGALLREVPSLHVVLKIAGGVYLLYLAYRIWSGASERLEVRTGDPAGGDRHLRKVFWLSLTTQLSNPKTAVVYGSIFTVFLPPEPSVALLIALVPGIFFVEFCWYAVVGSVFSIRKPREIYLGSKTLIDRIVGADLSAASAAGSSPKGSPGTDGTAPAILFPAKNLPCSTSFPPARPRR